MKRITKIGMWGITLMMLSACEMEHLIMTQPVHLKLRK